ncbi:hypothetical protein C0995_002067 [Termitomyces sp. Mi166|nr:hypothetical protein C0995_002067 [Termitomyces sp. Mi166\
MENFLASSSWDKMSHNDNPKLRMQSRPPRPQSKPVNSRRTGMAAEDLGSSFVKNAKQTKSKPSLKERKRAARNSPSDSSDELDILPPSSRASSRAGSVAVEDERVRKDGYTDEKGVYHKFHPAFLGESDVLKRLKFNKIKPPQGDDAQAFDAFPSQLLVVKEHGASGVSESSKPAPLPKHQTNTTRRAHSPARTTRNRPRSFEGRQGQSSAPKRDSPPPESTRPRPRPIGHKASMVQPVPKAFPGVSPLSSPARRMTISGTPSRSFSNCSPLRVSDNDDLGKPSPVKKVKAEPFLSSSPRAPSKFPSLDPLGSQEHITVKESSGKRSVSEKITTTKPPPLAAKKKKELAETKIRKQPSNSASSRRTIISSDGLGGNEGPERVDVPKAQPFPMSALGSSSPIDKAPPKKNTPKAQPFPMSTQVLDSIESPPPSDKAPTAQQFSMSVQVDSSTSSPSIAGSSTFKRSSSETWDEPDSKRLKGKNLEEEDAEQEIDPKTLCPYCDTPLPSQPTSQLKRLLASAAKKSCPEPRPGNHLGRTAPFTTYIAVCQRHRFESQMLPEAERKGWPKTIDWSELGKRVRKMKGALRAIIEGNGEDDCDEEESRPRARCVFWKEALEEVRLKGTRAVAGVRGQFASFEKMQPGYYGEMGSVIIHQTLYDLFPPASIDPDLVSPLTASEFLQRILVPEIAARLIMQDMELDESQMGDGVRILRESANYGVAMFPVDEGEEEGGSEDAGLGAADMIIMKRAMKRRKQLEADERAEEEEYQRQMREKAKEIEKQEPVKRARKKKGKESDAEVQESPPQISKARPKPRPLGKSTSTTSVNDVLSVGDTDVEDIPQSSQDQPKPRRIPSRSSTTLSQLEGDKDVEDVAGYLESSRPKPRQFPFVTSCISIADVEETSVQRPKPRRLVSRSTIDLQDMDTDETPRKAAVPTREPSTVDINLCSSSESSVDNDWDTGRMKRGQDQKKRRGKSKTSSSCISDDDGVVQVMPPSSSSRTPLPTRSREPTLPDSDGDTPKPRRKSKTLTSEMTSDDYWDIPPLQRARERNQKTTSKTDVGQQLRSLQVPIELLDRIIEFFIAQLPSESNTRRFVSIASLTLTSKTIRQLTLRRFFHDLYPMSREEWAAILRILSSLNTSPAVGREVSGFGWVRNLYTPSKVLSHKSARLHWLSHLRTLFIDLAQEGLSTQHPTIASIFSSLAPCITYPNLSSLTLSSLPRIDCLLLSLIARTFPRLVDLYLSCTERIEFDCCWACFEDSLGCTLHSPVPDDYLDVIKMAVRLTGFVRIAYAYRVEFQSAFATALKPLEYLEHLHFGIFLSDDSLLSSHISHVMQEETLQPVLQDWSECRRCFFDGAANEIRRRELKASIVVGQKLKTLKTIGWNSLVAGDTGPVRVEQYINSDNTIEDVADQSQDEEDDEEEHIAKMKVNKMEDQDMKTTIWILRSKGRIRVRRVPW